MGTTNSLSEGERYAAIYDSTRFKALRHEFSRFAVPATVVFVGWWFLAILLGAYAPGFFGLSVIGSVNVGTLAIMVTFALVIVIAAMYFKHARTRLDPLADEIRADAESAAAAKGGLR